MSKRIGDAHQIIERANRRAGKRCMHYDAQGRQCKNDAIQSHSLQKRGVLSSIAEEGHVIHLGLRLSSKSVSSPRLLERVGIQKASTFLGFCQSHDSTCFAEIEGKTTPLSTRTAFLFYLRNVAMELYRKRVMASLQIETIEHLEGLGRDSESIFPRLVLKGANMAINESEVRLKEGFRFLHRKIPENFLYFAAKYDGPAPFLASGGFEPGFDINGRYLFRKDPLKTKWNTLSIFCGNIDGNFHVFLGTIQKYKSHRVDKFLQSIVNTSRRDPATFFAIAAYHSENLFLKESWLSSLSLSDKQLMLDIQSSNLETEWGDPANFSVRLPIAKLNESGVSHNI